MKILEESKNDTKNTLHYLSVLQVRSEDNRLEVNISFTLDNTVTSTTTNCSQFIASEAAITLYEHALIIEVNMC